MQVIVDGLATSYLEHGSSKKPTVLILHGWADSADTFQQLSDSLKDSYHVVALNLPGFGKTQTPDKTWTLNDFALFTAHFVAKLDLKLHGLIGHSNGGAIGIKAVSQKMLKPKKLVLIASSGIRRPYTFRNTALKALTKSSKFVLHLAPKKTREQLKQKLYRRIGSDFLVVEGMKDTFKNIITEDVLDYARNIKVPTVLIYGDEDHATPQVYGALFTDAIPDAQLHVIEDAGHFVHLDEPAETTKIIREFLKGSQ
jgi:pimeloyl-ACP methyl ester carboxylesterase